jgi:antitoxin (DNA-binding transcriptional repressor) of toxin-antitoxin stability system
MKIITATELARNLRKVLDQVAETGGEYSIERNRQVVARVLPGVREQNALEAMADLYQRLPTSAAATWEEETRGAVGRFDDTLPDPWR